MSYLGNTPVVNASRLVFDATATSGQTVITPPGGYTVGQVEVIINGAQLSPDDFTATDGSAITLTQGLALGDAIKIVAYGTFAVANTYSQAQVDSKIAAIAPTYKNRLINGGMVVGQRGNIVFTGTNNLYGWVDRWLVSVAGTTVSALGYQANAQPTSTGYSLQVGNVNTTGTSLVQVSQRIEAMNCADLNGSVVTFSGKVRQVSGATQTMTFGINKATAGVDNWGTQTSVASTSLSVPNNTWTNFSFTTTLGSADASNGLAVFLLFNGLSAQSNSQWYFGDCQLEKGSVATSFDYRPYGTELQLCQRYYQKTFPQSVAPAQNAGYNASCLVWNSSGSNNAYGTQVQWRFPVTMRSAPTVTYYNPAAANGSARNFAISADMGISGSPIAGPSEVSTQFVSGDTASGPGHCCVVHVAASAEL